MLGYTFCGITAKGLNSSVGKQLRTHQKSIEAFHITWIYKQAKGNVDLDTVLAAFKAA